MTKFYCKKIFLILIVVFLSTSCSSKLQKALPSMPDKDLRDELNTNAREHNLGWKDGCETGISSGSNTFYKMFYRSNKIDGYLSATSSDYRDAWDMAFWYCYRSTYIRQKSSLWGSIFKGFR